MFSKSSSNPSQNTPNPSPPNPPSKEILSLIRSRTQRASSTRASSSAQIKQSKEIEKQQTLTRKNRAKARKELMDAIINLKEDAEESASSETENGKTWTFPWSGSQKNIDSETSSSSEEGSSENWSWPWENGSGNDGNWVKLIKKTEISPGELVPVTILGVDLLVIAPPPTVLPPTSKTSKNPLNIYCVSNSCPHLGTPLETGRLSLTNNNVCITCPLHRTMFELGEGEVEGDWCPYPPVLGPMSGILKGTQVKGRELPVFKVREKGKWLEVRVDSDMSDIFCVDD
ncbi:hypothetical protein TrLO_g15029 [Triparma laevis f. longispina]|nr:hypothetical protein TrLO_g15029 [Triparma laevis f. longispina]